MKLLALDVATKTGWTLSPDSGLFGTWDFSIKRDESGGLRLMRFKAKLKEIHEAEGINLVVYERTAGRHRGAIIVQSELHGMMKTWCEENKVEYRAYSAPEIKKFATGKGNSGKPLMIQACIDKYNITPVDDNSADSLHLWHLAKQDLNL